MRLNPPAPAITGDVVRITPQVEIGSGVAQLTLDYMCSALGAVTTAVLLQLATDAKAALDPSFKACLSQEATIIRWLAACISVSGPASRQAADSTVGTVAQPSLPNEMGAVILKQSILKGQHGRGRVTVPAVPITFTTPATTPDVINATGVAAYGTFQAALLAVITSSGLNFIPVISTRPSTPGGLVANAQVVQAMTLTTLLGTARRRKFGRGT